MTTAEQKERKKIKAEKVRQWQHCRAIVGLCIQCGARHSTPFWRCPACCEKQRAYAANKKHKTL